MRRAVVALALVACSYKDREREPPPPPTKVLPIRAVLVDPAPPDAAAAEPAPLAGLALPIVHWACAKPLADCVSPDLMTSDGVPIGVQGCPVASALELRLASFVVDRCALAVKQGNDLALVETLLSCPIHGGKQTRARPLAATCTAGTLDVPLEVRDDQTTRTVHLTCRGTGAALACSRAPDLDLGGAGVARTLADVKRVVEAHQWRALLELCAPDHRRSQLDELHQPVPTYLAEILGVHALHNSLADGTAPITYDMLSTISRIDWLEVSRADGGGFTVLGLATVNGARLRVTLVLVADHGRFLLSGAVG